MREVTWVDEAGRRLPGSIDSDHAAKPTSGTRSCLGCATNSVDTWRKWLTRHHNVWTQSKIGRACIVRRNGQAEPIQLEYVMAQVPYLVFGSLHVLERRSLCGTRGVE